MEQVSLTGQIICAVIMAAVFYFAASLVMTMAVPITELSGAGASPIYQLVLIGFGALGALIGWKCYSGNILRLELTKLAKAALYPSPCQRV